ncbi:MAG: Uncharacterized protein XD97_0177 [Pelotomaculum thermopropionicum]|uniref:Coat F domain-containing protein n=1 Tax=Pelotomaculum thermopropionicum TaxID=110500 RepID=A0A101HVN3_9FIRM|nr:MAG: Uncharacterized protein XD97_0177 [Pelotomaculum thermopropionicum]
MVIDEKDRLTDTLITQKYIASGYNSAASESANTQLMENFMGILRDEQQIQHEIFNEMKNRGWYQPSAAKMNDITQSLNQWSQELQRVQNNAFRRQGMQQSQPPGYQSGIPQYSYQPGFGQQQMGEAQQQPMYRPPQNPMA